MAGGLFFCPNQHDHRPTKQASCSFGLWRREAAGGHCDYRRLIRLIRTPAIKSALPSPALTTHQAGRSMEATTGAIVMDNADSSLNLRTIVPSPRDLGQAAAR
jgi:hypothetical protein